MMAKVVRGYLLLSVLVIALFAMVVMADTEPKDVNAEHKVEKVHPKTLRSGSRPLRSAKASSTAHHRSAVTTASPPAVPAVPANLANAYEQQVLVVKGNPSEEKLNEEIRKAIRALLGPGQSDEVQIRELKNEDELRRYAPGARPIGVKLVP